MKRNICIVLFIALALLNIYDVFSTNALFTSGGKFYEANPVMRWIMHEIGVSKFINLLIVLKGMALLWIFSLVVRARTNREFNMASIGFALATGYYATTMYFANYQAMLSLAGGV